MQAAEAARRLRWQKMLSPFPVAAFLVLLLLVLSLLGTLRYCIARRYGFGGPARNVAYTQSMQIVRDVLKMKYIYCRPVIVLPRFSSHSGPFFV
jgi:hypothetical protein